MSATTWEYETKCRRCGSMAERYNGSKKKIKEETFLKAIEDMLTTPKALWCRTCQMDTVQDIVSYN